MAEVLRNTFSYSKLEKEILEENATPSIFQRYGTHLRIGSQPVYVVDAPATNAKKVPPLPVAILIHGLGGNTLNFSHLFQDLNWFSKVIVIDLPGHGESPEPKDWGICSPHRIVELIEVVLERTAQSMPFVAIGHSYGTTHALRLSIGKLKEQCLGVVCLTPPFRDDPPWLAKTCARWLPSTLFDTFLRPYDRTGGLHSPSISRMVAPTAGEEPRREQLRINLMANSKTILQTVGRISFYKLEEGIPKCPVLVIGALDDQVCPVTQAKALYEQLEPHVDVQFLKVPDAGHAILFERPEVVSGVVSRFLREKVDERLSRAWQLSFLAASDDKWSLKNEVKWRDTVPVGDVVGKSCLVGMKVPRQDDDVHGPASLEHLHPEIHSVIDISREAPPYDPTTFKHIKYHKFPTVSKIPPSKSEVKEWIQLINNIVPELGKDELIAIHCHYGFNRTGFFICSYLIEELGYAVPDALKAYSHSRPPGIRHAHFIDELFVRYSL